MDCSESCRRGIHDEENPAVVLAVDDDPDYLALLQTRFNDAAFKLVTLSSAEEALEFVNTDTPVDVAILDINIPGSTAFELLHAFRSQHHNFPVVLLSGHVDQHVRELADEELGIELLNKKDCDLEALRDRLCCFLNSSQSASRHAA